MRFTMALPTMTPSAILETSAAFLGVRRGQRKPVDTDVFRLFTGLGNIVGRLHPHKGIHLYAERLLQPQRHLPGQISLPIQETRQGGTRHLKSLGGCRHRQACRLDDLP
jgi:hypothetical protein